jgi:hypothetical protein
MPKFSGMVMVVRLADALDVYTSSMRNNVRSRSLTGPEHPGLSLRVQGSAVYKTAEDRAKLTHVVQRPPRLQVPAAPDQHIFFHQKIIFFSKKIHKKSSFLKKDHHFCC